MPDASPFWQNAFLVGVIVVVGWSGWCGWRAGVVREALALGGMFLGGIVGLAVGGAVAPLVGTFLPLPGALLGLGVGLAVGVGIYAGIWLLGAMLFKRTAQQGSFLLRLVFGGGGALLGVFFGVTLVWGALLGVRALGGFYEARFEPEARLSPLPRPGAAEAALVKLKRSIEAGDTGQRLLAIDIVPAGVYRNFDKLGRVVTRPEALRRFFQYPAMLELVNDPRIVAITLDPDVSDAAQAQRVGALLGNRRVLEAANDPALIAKIQAIDFEAALDFALAPAAAPASSVPQSSKSPASP